MSPRRRAPLVRRLPLAGLLGALVLLAAPTLELPGAAAGAQAPTRVLLTNDNGIEDAGLVELARALARAPGFEVVVVASTADRSGTSNFLGATGSGEFRVERRDLGPGIEAWALHGYPADCVVFALTGPMRESPPDLVVSGINGGPNLADDWFGSGTIGAARTAAYFGIPAVAVSGVEDDDPASVEAATSWVVELVRSRPVRVLEAPEYLTVSLPVTPPGEIRGVKVVERARGVTWARSTRTEEAGPDDGTETWRVELVRSPEDAGPGTDVRAVRDGFIAVVPMRAGESAPELTDRLRAMAGALPGWNGAVRSGR